MTDHPTNGLDETVHQRHRLGILTIAAEAKLADFRYLRDTLELTAGNLSRHLTVLEDAGMVTVEKGYEGRRARTWVRITRQGRSALAAELDALATLVRQHVAAVKAADGAKSGDAVQTDDAAQSEHAAESDELGQVKAADSDSEANAAHSDPD
jgi:DNA-binding MarR family transcriptional regulator